MPAKAQIALAETEVSARAICDCHGLGQEVPPTPGSNREIQGTGRCGSRPGEQLRWDDAARAAWSRTRANEKILVHRRSRRRCVEEPATPMLI
ncbi:hypothetical protein Kisp01_13560 [Kineosporia sp. NBRC 101677]|nr:hypothetical protein Kisp01_13560 [Kineosporia sp. NBRC 101677]